MNRLRKIHWSQIFVQSGYEIRKLSNLQLLTVLQFKFNLKYNKQHLKDPYHKPFFLERGQKLNIYFQSNKCLHNRQDKRMDIK